MKKDKDRKKKHRAGDARKEKKRKGKPEGKLVSGVYRGTGKGFAFLTPDDGGEDIFIPPKGLGGALNGDRVTAYVRTDKETGKREASVKEVTQQTTVYVVGTYAETRDGRPAIVPDDGKVCRIFIVEDTGGLKPKPGYKVVGQPLERDGDTLFGTLIEVLGEPNVMGVDILSIARAYGLSEEFPPEVEAAARDSAFEVSEEEKAGREDFRGDTVVTIDGLDAKDLDDAICVKRKGKGYELAEKMPAAYHGVGKFDPARGTSSVHQPCFSDVFGQTLTELALENPRVCAITAAMRDGTGLKTFSETCPDRFFDVGIAEEHALSMACGMAKQGLIPAVAIYSTFLQRAFDMPHDLALLQLHVVLGVDRAGLVGEDGRTHHGMFDVGYLRQVPGLKIYCPASFAELRVMLREAVLTDTCPVAVRYPRGGEGAYRENAEETRLKEGTSCTVITYGTMINAVLEAAEAAEKDGLSAEILKLRTIAPIDWAAIEAACRKTGRVLVVEETSDRGCVANDIFSHLAQANISCVCAKQNLGASFIGHGAMQDLYELTGLNANALLGRIREVCHEA